MLGQQSSIRVMDANHVTENSFTEGHVAESNNDQVNCTPNAPASFVPLEDCKCPICLDYFIDVVETRCKHRFCNFCLENWLRVSLHRQCPTCRSTIVGSTQVKSDLQEMIDASIQSVLNEEMVQERAQIRLRRQEQVERFSVDREQTQALLARITSSRPRARHIRRGRRYSDTENGTRDPFISRHLLNWWDELVTAEEPEDRVHIESDTAIEDLPYGWLRHLRGFESSVDVEAGVRESTNPATLPGWNTVGSDTSSNSPRNNSRGQQRTTVSHFDQSYHENLMEEYSYHLRRVNSAHTRIREAYRDFNYHNGRMQEILQEHRSFFSMRASSENPSDDNNSVRYENSMVNGMGDMDMGELLDNSPAAQVVFGRFLNDNSSSASTVPPHNSMHNVIRSPYLAGRNADHNTVLTRRNSRRFHRVLLNDAPTTSRTHVLDMEHEIRHRRSQLNQLNALVRASPYSRGSLPNNDTSNDLSRASQRISSPMPPSEPESRRDELLTNQIAGNQVTLERLTTGQRVSTVRSRRMRRRSARTSSFGTNAQMQTSDPVSVDAQRAYNESTQLTTVIPLHEVNMSANTDILNHNPVPNPINSSNTRSEALRDSQAGVLVNGNCVNRLQNSSVWLMNDSSESDNDEPSRAERDSDGLVNFSEGEDRIIAADASQRPGSADSSSTITNRSTISSTMRDISSMTGVTQRVVDVINQCRYLSSKSGLTLKQLRLSLRDDEAKQRELVRTALHSPSFHHMNNHGMIYSQYNVQNYGHIGSKTVVSDEWPHLVEPKKGHLSPRICNYQQVFSNEKTTTDDKWDNLVRPEESLINKQSDNTNLNSAITYLDTYPAQLENNDSMVDLLYSANRSNKPQTRGNSPDELNNRNFYEYRLDGSSSENSNSGFLDCSLATQKGKVACSNSMVICKSVSKCNLPARKMASHNLASLHSAEENILGEDDSSMIAVVPSKASLDIDQDSESGSEFDSSEFQVFEEVDRNKTVVSPLIRKAESAFVQLQNSDSLFGTLDDFGKLMSKANHML